MPKGAGCLPDRWLDYKPVNGAIFRFIPFKVPLKESLGSRLPSEQQFDWPTLISHLERKDLQLGLVIDLCNTNRYYDPVDIEKASSNKILHYKIYCQGHTDVPSPEDFKNFATQVKEFLRHSSDNLYIGVHCTHGVNRTGFLICKFLILFEGWDPAVAVKTFTSARGHEFDKTFYVEHLLNLVPNRRESLPPDSPTSSPKPQLHQHIIFSDGEDQDLNRGISQSSGSDRRIRPDHYEGRDSRRFESRNDSPSRGGNYRGSEQGGDRRKQTSSDYTRGVQRGSDYSRYPNMNRGRIMSPGAKRDPHDSQLRGRKRSGDREVMDYDRFVQSRKESSTDYERAPAYGSRDNRSPPRFSQRDNRMSSGGFHGKDRDPPSRRHEIDMPPHHFQQRRHEGKGRMDRSGRLSPRGHPEDFKRRPMSPPRRDSFYDRPNDRESRSPVSRHSSHMSDYPGDQYRKRPSLLQDPIVERRQYHDDRSAFVSSKPPASKYSRLSKSPPRSDYRRHSPKREPDFGFDRHSNDRFAGSRGDRNDHMKESRGYDDFNHGGGRKHVPPHPTFSGGFDRDRRDDRSVPEQNRYGKMDTSLSRGDFDRMGGRSNKESVRTRDRYDARDYSPPPRVKLESAVTRDGILVHPLMEERRVPSTGRSSYSPLRSQVIAGDSKPPRHTDAFADRSPTGYKTGRTSSGIEFSLPGDTMSNKLRISDYQSQSVLSPPNSPPRHYSRSTGKDMDRGGTDRRAYDQETGLGFRDTRERFGSTTGDDVRDSRDRGGRSPDRGEFRGRGSSRGEPSSPGYRGFRARLSSRYLGDRRGGTAPRSRGRGLGPPRISSRGSFRGGSGRISSSVRGSSSTGLFTSHSREKMAGSYDAGRGRGSRGGGFRGHPRGGFPRSSRGSRFPR